MENEELKICPFCGAKAELQNKKRYRTQPEKFRVIDTNTECKIFPSTQWCEGKEDAIEAWNTRV